MAKQMGPRNRRRGSTRKQPAGQSITRTPAPIQAVADDVESLAPEFDGEADRAATSDIPTVVGVGASAGGLEAFSQLLEALPATANVAVIFVQHLSPQHESALQTLLASRTSLPVIQVVDGLRIEPQHIYVVPPNVQMGIVDGALHLLPRPGDRSQYTPIDFFLQSLAQWAHNRAIGVILSGTASDGAVGIREIKSAGGITIAQKPKTAKYDGMPRAAIATGMIDLVLSPQEIAEEIAHIHAHPYLDRTPVTAQRAEATPTDEQLGEIFALLRRVSGVDFRQYKTPTVKRRLLRRMALHRLHDSAAYLRYLRENVKEAHALYQDLLIHVTRFFREPESFKVLVSEVFPELIASRSEDEAFRFWVPGCATGEEPYSVAIALLETMEEQGASHRVQIFGTDVSESAIEQARAGVYPPSISADVSAERLKRFFIKADGSYRVSKALRDVCVFARHDLSRDPPFSRLDLIVCRNVMIYLDAAIQKRLISVFHYALKSTGYLMLGPAETTGHQHLFSVVDKRWRLYRKAALDAALPIGFSLDRYPHLPAAAGELRGAAKPDSRSVHDEASRMLLQRYGPASVVVDDKLQIVQFRGQTGPFLEPASGEPTLDLLKMAREGLLFPMRTALQKARLKHHAVREEGVSVRRNGGWHDVNIEVVPLSSGGGRHFLVTFDEPPLKPPRKRGRRSVGGRRNASTVARRESDERIAGLTRELTASREYLQSIIQELEAANEELQSANEEILSSNEELQSTNEELDTAKEELQSTNEELNTVNEELHSRNEELSRVNSDLVNLLATVDITILIVGDDMRIRRFTPTAERMLNLIPGDIGRPVGQINTNLAAESLESLIRETIDTMTGRELEAQDRQGKWYSLKIRPYKNIDNRIDGAVLTMMDIGAVKRYQEQIERARVYLLKTLELVNDSVVVLDDAMIVRFATDAFLAQFRLSVDELTGTSVFEVARKRWNVAPLRALLKQIQETDGEIERAVIEHDFLGEGRARRFVVNGRRIPFEDSRWTVLTFKDGTDAESSESA